MQEWNSLTGCREPIESAEQGIDSLVMFDGLGCKTQTPFVCDRSVDMTGRTERQMFPPRVYSLSLPDVRPGLTGS